MKRILYIEANRDGTIGGSYYSLLYLIQGLDKTKYEPHVIFCQDNVLIPEFRKITSNVYVNDFGPSSSNPIERFGDLIKWPYRLFTRIILKQSKLNKIISKIKPDLVHLNNGYGAVHEWMLACYLHKIKVIAHDRGTRFPCTNQTKLFVRFLDAIISVSDSYKDNVLRQRLRVKNAFRVYNGLDIEKMKIEADSCGIKQLMEQFGIQENQPVIGIIGNIDRWKGQLVVLQAVKLLKKRYPEIKCLIVGSVIMRAERYKEELDRYIQENNLQENIVFTGYRSDIPAVLQMMDVLVHASIEPEPFGRVILEGMATRRPIIATNIGGPSEILVDGESGILIPVNDPEKLAESLIYYLSNPKKAREMGEKAQERLISMFSVKKMVDGVEEIYEKVLAN